jgi:D-arabinose 1-dehydrogenase-like Zn-dependent alcohol dehydrogenase
LVTHGQTLIGSIWFTAAQGQEMADMASFGRVDLSVFETKIYPLDQIDAALNDISFGCGGFTNYVIAPDR